jgi:hypothetical protein
VSGRGKHSRSIWKDYDTLDFRHEVPSRHSVYLRVTDVYRWGGRRPQDAAPRASARASHSCSLIYIRQYLLRFGSVCRVIHSHRQARSGIPIVTSTLGHSPEHRVHLHRHRPPTEIHLMITLKSGSTHVGTPRRTTVSSLWWPQTGIGPATTPVGIPLLEDQRRLMHKPLAWGWFRI